MGLDGVELVMEIEETFDIEIPDEEYPELTTVGELYNFILGHLRMQHDLQKVHPVCPTIPAFLATRVAFQSLLPVKRNELRPGIALESIVPLKHRKRVWRELQSLTHIQLPELMLPSAVMLAVCLITFTIPAVLLAAMLPTLKSFSLVLALISGMMVFYLLHLLTRPLAVMFPSGYQTIGDVVRCARPPHYPSQIGWKIPTEADAVWNRLVEIIVSVLYVPEADVKPEARFYEDLRVD